MSTRRNVLTAITVAAVALLFAVHASVLTTVSRGAAPAETPRDLRAEHITMIERMRRDVSPEMVEHMNAPEWRWMRDAADLSEIETHVRDFDRMLGRIPRQR